VGLNPQSDDNPLGDYLDSLDKLEAFGVARSAHSGGSTTCNRLAELRQHHDHRLAEVVTAIRRATRQRGRSRRRWSGAAFEDGEVFTRRGEWGDGAPPAARSARDREEIDGEPARWQLIELSTHDS
jgi:hypothetical protein